MKPDVLLRASSVLTMSRGWRERPRPRVVAVGGGRILAVGGEELLDGRGAGTRVVDLGSGVLLPGFVDAHCHPVAGGVALLQCDLSGIHGLQDYRRAIADHAATHGGPWIEGAGWYGDVFPGGYPTRELLDDVVWDRPVALVSHDAHSYWVNSRALELAGIDADTVDPPGGRIVRDASGAPSGLLMENAMGLLDGVKPPVGAELIRSALVTAEKYFHSVGITSWVDAAVGRILGFPDAFEQYLQVAGDLTSRVTLALLVPPGATPGDLEVLVGRRQELATLGTRVRVGQAKLILDGNCENLTAAVHEPYAGSAQERGLLQFGRAELARVAATLDARGFDLHLHAVGDRAVTAALDALESLGADTVARGRHHQIAHIDLVRGQDVVRMAHLGTAANVTPLWARQDPVLVETKLPLLTQSQRLHHFLLGTLERAGVAMAFGSDWPVSSPDPLAQVHTAVNRTAAPGDPHACDARSRGEPLLASEAMSVSGALEAATRGAAVVAGLGAQVGRIEAGMEADLVVIDRDPTTVSAQDLGALRVTATFVGGQCVFGA